MWRKSCLKIYTIYHTISRCYSVQNLATRFKDGELSDEELELIELGDEESLEDIKAKLKPKKSTISADMLDTANTYDDKVALVRMIVGDEAGRVVLCGKHWKMQIGGGQQSSVNRDVCELD